MRFIGVIALLSGCFYMPEVNQRPGLEIRSNGAALVRGGSAEFEAVVVDPEADAVELDWRIYACGPVPDGAEPAEFGDCDTTPFQTGSTATFEVAAIPAFREPRDGAAPEPTRGIRVTLDGRDDRGAGAKPNQILAVAVGNAAPTLALAHVPSVYEDTVGTPIDVFAAYGDPDDQASGVTVAWQVFAPSEVPFDAPVDIPAPDAPTPGDLQVGKRFIPTVEGVWQIRVVATDGAGAQREQTIPITVIPDRAPCLDQESPLIAEGATLPVFEPLLVSAGVDDNLDIYPYLSIEDSATADPAKLIDPARFTWSLKVGAGPREIIVDDEVQNSVAFDPAAYAAGTIVEIRVEIEDRIARTLTCPDADATCAVVSGSGCLQRRTWRVEAR